jgi:hypothetical protein
MAELQWSEHTLCSITDSLSACSCVRVVIVRQTSGSNQHRLTDCRRIVSLSNAAPAKIYKISMFVGIILRVGIWPSGQERRCSTPPDDPGSILGRNGHYIHTYISLDVYPLPSPTLADEGYTPETFVFLISHGYQTIFKPGSLFTNK